MAAEGYVAQVWEDSVSPVNAERLNHMEEGIEQATNMAQEALDNAGGSGGGSMVVNVAIAGSPSEEEDGSMTYYDLTLDKTLDEILAAAEAGQFVCAKLSVATVLCIPLVAYDKQEEEGRESTATFFAIIPNDSYMKVELAVGDYGNALSIKEVTF